jgi:AhpD family alkylhydroperoxidase
MHIPAARLSLAERVPRAQFATMFRLAQSIELEHGLHTLVSLRASQINGCAFCIDMHWLDARAAGESEARLYGLDAWRDSPLYSERERAALELCEAMTLVAETGVPDDVWERARASFDEDELAQLVVAIGAINLWNRVNIATRVEPGHYRPGAFAPAAA